MREVSPDGVISTVAGTGRDGFSGDGGPATAARICGPAAVAVLPDGGFIVADAGNRRVREVRADGTISTVAGGGTTTLARGIGDGGPASAAVLIDPLGVAALPDGGFVVADVGLARIRSVAPDGTITTLAGGGPLGLGAVAADAGADVPGHLVALSDGGVAFVDGNAGTVDEVVPTRTPRLLIALQPAFVRTRSGRPAALRLIATQAAQLTVDVIGRHHRRVRRTYTRARAARRTCASAASGLAPIACGSPRAPDAR